jgi:hypothetical protein
MARVNRDHLPNVTELRIESPFVGVNNWPRLAREMKPSCDDGEGSE